ncbi:MAG TPA: CvpA family protein [Patescibacteria group bacterium]
MTWVDWIVIIFFIVGALIGFWRGFVAQVFLIVGLVVAIIFTFWSFPIVGSWIEAHFQIPITFARPLSLLVIFFLSSSIFHFLAQFVHRLIAPMVQANMVNRGLGSAVGAARHLLIASILLALLVTLPTSSKVKAQVDNSKTGRPLVRFALQLEKGLSRWIQDEDLKSLSYRIIGTDQTTTTALNFSVSDPTVDETGEKELFVLTNASRVKEKQKPLLSNDKLREVARAHAKDMLQKGYFSHLSPQGKDVAKRVGEANITVTLVGENLASAPTIEIAHLGLLASPGHKKNIMSSDYNEVGIAVLDAGRYGKMVVEVFAKTY